jgi:hypothetical protein
MIKSDRPVLKAGPNVEAGLNEFASGGVQALQVETG